MSADRQNDFRDTDLHTSQGLYDPRFEHDSCGVNFVCNLRGKASHDIVKMGIGALCTLQHRGAIGAESNTGDGAGILMQIPDKLYREVVSFDLPKKNHRDLFYFFFYVLTDNIFKQQSINLYFHIMNMYSEVKGNT